MSVFDRYLKALDSLERLEAKNVELHEMVANLRKLVRDMMQFFEDSNWCDKCDHACECDSQEQYEDDCLMRFVFRNRMAQLGVEVD